MFHVEHPRSPFEEAGSKPAFFMVRLTGAVPGGGASGRLGGESPLHARQGEVLADGTGARTHLRKL